MHNHVADLNDICPKILREPDTFVVTLQTAEDIKDCFYELNETLRNETYVTLMKHWMRFDKNMRLITQVPLIDGWNVEIKYFNYNVPQPVKRQKTS